MKFQSKTISSKTTKNKTTAGLKPKTQTDLNVDKYGTPDDDVIARAYKEGQHIGDIWCYKNVERYLRRFSGTSHKSGNFTDLLKAQDYMNRMVEANRHLAETGQLSTKEVIE